jgi:hypothetical protein
MEDLHYTPIAVRDILQKKKRRKLLAKMDHLLVTIWNFHNGRKINHAAAKFCLWKRNSCSRAADWG